MFLVLLLFIVFLAIAIIGGCSFGDYINRRRWGWGRDDDWDF